MKTFNPEYYKDYTYEELVDRVCLLEFELKVSKCILATTGYDMKQPLDYSYYKKLLDPTNELKYFKEFK